MDGDVSARTGDITASIVRWDRDGSGNLLSKTTPVWSGDVSAADAEVLQRVLAPRLARGYSLTVGELRTIGSLTVRELRARDAQVVQAMKYAEDQSRRVHELRLELAKTRSKGRDQADEVKELRAQVRGARRVLEATDDETLVDAAERQVSPDAQQQRAIAWGREFFAAVDPVALEKSPKMQRVFALLESGHLSELLSGGDG